MLKNTDRAAPAESVASAETSSESFCEGDEGHGAFGDGFRDADAETVVAVVAALGNFGDADSDNVDNATLCFFAGVSVISGRSNLALVSPTNIGAPTGNLGDSQPRTTSCELLLLTISASNARSVSGNECCSSQTLIASIESVRVGLVPHGAAVWVTRPVVRQLLLRFISRRLLFLGL